MPDPYTDLLTSPRDTRSALLSFRRPFRRSACARVSRWTKLHSLLFMKAKQNSFSSCAAHLQFKAKQQLGMIQRGKRAVTL